LAGGVLVATACGGGLSPAPLTPLPAPPPVTGPLAIHLAYPLEARRTASGDTTYIAADPASPLPAVDSVFVYGSVGRGNAWLSINGAAVPVYPTGGWIAWLPLPPDTIARFALVAGSGADTARAVFLVPVVHRYTPPSQAAWVDTTSLVPRGARWVRPGESVRLGVRAAPGATVQLRLSDGRRIAFQPDERPAPRSAAAVAFQAPAAAPAPRAAPGRYLAAWAEGTLGPDPGPVLAPVAAPADSDSRWPVVEVIVGGDTARARWPLRIGTVDVLHPPVVTVDDDTAHSGATDSTLAGRPAPGAAYYWFFPNGTVAAVSGRYNDQVRLQLSRTSVAWVDAPDVHAVAAPPPGGVVRSVRMHGGTASVTLRIPLPARVPFHIEESGAGLSVRLYGVQADMNWMQYGSTDPFVRLLQFHQATEDEAVISVELSQAVFGYRTHWDGDDLLLEIRRPPIVDRHQPLKGRRIAIDAGHPPLGARGPTGLREPDMTLAIARRVQALLTLAGAQVVMVRPDERPLGLVERLRIAERADAEVLVSIHGNGLPDGINPFLNTGTSTYYFQPRSAPLARALDAGLVRQLGFRDLGFGRGDLALVRPTWMPAALAEGLFLQMPDQEAVLASEAGQQRYAQGIVDGLIEYLRGLGR
jgi:N-acetylmuramoyl-L-alanine amidase